MIVKHYEIELTPAARRQFKKLASVVQRDIVKKLEKLVLDPRPLDIKKLKGSESLYRVRVGDYRIVYEIHDNKLIILVVKVGHRKEIYELL